jgi:hypothetical protein
LEAVGCYPGVRDPQVLVGHALDRPTSPAADLSTRGQALVEFSLVLPILLLLLLTVGDFGRLFAATITIDRRPAQV